MPDEDIIKIKKWSEEVAYYFGSVNTKEMVKMEDGRELPLYKLDTSSESHAFYTGTQKSVDNMGGRVEKFRNPRFCDLQR